VKEKAKQERIEKRKAAERARWLKEHGKKAKSSAVVDGDGVEMKEMKPSASDEVRISVGTDETKEASTENTLVADVSGMSKEIAV